MKLKYSPTLAAFSVSRPLPLGVTYPYDWGFVPSTEGPDGDPIDAAVFWDVSSFPGVVIPCRPLAVVQVDQKLPDGSGRGRNDRILAVPTDARRQKNLDVASALPPRVREEIELFFLTAAALEGKDPRILGWGDAAAVLDLLRASSK